ncbi:hypothetical protein KDX38_12765 [Pseudomonas sp. CDFA 602]|uniref:hypothetical protein n=1 Tax=Pseudomonas californiensis TaxID=2829823 RepID=UPI001E45645A|nr:hypothetical protein [Pseudomonas californiensis]MCD5994550.1 hypothetical protein [Pseudomonas californiensis]MCD6000088.1 hypothetical protein [Pseudomonas californiensis]
MTDHDATPQKERDNDKPYTPTVDQSGKPVEVVREDIEREGLDTNGVDKVVTPTANKEKEQDAETLKEKNREVERKLAGKD